MRLLICISCWCLSFTSFAQQTQVSGRVVDMSGENLPGATVLLKEIADLGTITDNEGHFTLPVSASQNSITLVVSAVGFTKRKVRVAVASYTLIRLSEQYDDMSNDLSITPKAIVGFSSGLRYSPYGITASLLGARLVRLPLTTLVDYQTNMHRNHALRGQLGMPIWSGPSFGSPALQGLLAYQQLQAVPAQLRFTAYTVTLGLHQYHIGQWRPPALLVTAGWTPRQQPSADFRPRRAGAGYGLGFQYKSFRPFGFWLETYAHATRWPDYWQWTGQVTHPFSYNYRVGLRTDWLRRYREISVTLTRSFR